MATFNWTQLAEDLKVEALAGLDGLISGAKEDLEEFGKAIALDLVRAAREQRQDILLELGHQLMALGEAQRITLVNATWAQVSNVLTVIGRVAIKMAMAAI